MKELPVRNQFASDNYAGVCPEAWEAMEQSNRGYVASYGDDAWTEKACLAIRDIFETDCEVFFVFTGTAANSLALASLCKSYHSVICHETSHVETDECGASEFFSNGTKVLLVPGPEGKVSLEAVEHTVLRRSDIHYPKPRALSITQATELGTVYSVDELHAAGEVAKRFNLHVHMDGSRFANAVAALDVAPKELSWRAGVDVLCFGGAKNGLALGEAVIFFNRALAEEFDYRCKQAGQLASKMRYLAAPWAGLLQTGAWLKNAAHANRCARLLSEKLQEINGVTILYPAEANSVFLELPPHVISGLRQRQWTFYTFIGGAARFMCSWETTDEDITALVRDIEELCGVA